MTYDFVKNVPAVYMFPELMEGESRSKSLLPGIVICVAFYGESVAWYCHLRSFYGVRFLSRGLWYVLLIFSTRTLVQEFTVWYLQYVHRCNRRIFGLSFAPHSIFGLVSLEHKFT
jgi:hypothetical protein